MPVESDPFENARVVYPCAVCQRTADAVSALGRGVRLGTGERRLLLAAAPSGARLRTPVLPLSGTVNGQVSARRAVAKLRRVGLVIVYDQPLRVRRDKDDASWNPLLGGKAYRVLRAYDRTPLGDAVVEQIGARLAETDAPYVWLDAGTLAAARAAVIAGCPHRS